MMKRLKLKGEKIFFKKCFDQYMVLSNPRVGGGDVDIVGGVAWVLRVEAAGVGSGGAGAGTGAVVDWQSCVGVVCVHPQRVLHCMSCSLCHVLHLLSCSLCHVLHLLSSL